MVLAASFAHAYMKFFAILLLCLLAVPGLAIPAFPGAEGAGANATGGRGGTVYHVTNTNDSGAGSLRTGVSGPNRTIVFDVSGTINLLTDLKITATNLTIAGQTAPGDGITLARRLTSVQNTRNVVVRFIRCRPGDADSTFQDDAFHFVNATNCIVDHLSASWSVDECLSTTHSTNITVQWCLISESLKNSRHDKGAHGYGALLRYGQGQLTYHHNLFQHHDSRNPRLGDNLKLDFVNNVIYNWGGTAGYSGTYENDIVDSPLGFTNYVNYVSNYLVAGISTGSSSTAFRGYTTNTVIYQTGNRIDSNKNTLLDGTETGSAMFAAPYTASATRYPMDSSVAADSAPAAYQRVLAFGGASAVRDAVDYRLIGTVNNHLGRLVDAVGPNDQITDYVTNNINGTNYVFVRGWPALNSTVAPTDTDQDGMPDYWELNLGKNPNVANNNNLNPDGYTDLENYLNWLADLHALGRVNLTASTSLRSLAGNNTNLNFTVANATNGSVSLAGDGFTAQFMPPTNFIGLAAFTFNASNVVDHIAFGPITVTLLITNAVPVIVTPPASSTNNVGMTTAFAVAAANAGLTYQWRKNGTNLINGGNISGGVTNAALTFTNLVGTNAGNYSVVASNFSGVVTSSIAVLAVVSNTAPTLAAISNRTLIAGATLTFTNTANDADLPPQTLTFSPMNFPAGASVNSSNGIFNWRPTIAQGGTTNAMSVVVSDNGVPVMSATQSFSVVVVKPASPLLQVSAAGSQLNLSVTGDIGPDYVIRASTNLTDWSTLLITNPPLRPFTWSDFAAGSFNRRFYRVELGP
jgi:hypothetical protein